MNGASATESDPIKVASSDIPTAKGLPFLAPAKRRRSLKIIAIAKAPSNFDKVFFIATSALNFLNSSLKRCAITSLSV